MSQATLRLAGSRHPDGTRGFRMGWMASNPHRNKSGVYFIFNGRLEIKIGKGKNPVANLAAHQISNPEKLTLLCVLPCPISDLSRQEESIHKKFADAWIRGEWFIFTPELQSFVQDLVKECGCCGQ